MANFLSSYGLFLAKSITVVVAIIFVVGIIVSIIQRSTGRAKDRIQVKNLNDKFKDLRHDLQQEVLAKKEFKKLVKTEKKADKKEPDATRKKIWVLDFKGDINATAVQALREEITAILTVATPEDQVVLRLESSGGIYHSYGFAASQLQRLKDKTIPLTIIVDNIAASGGYMMACVADRLLAAPFAVVGSIGVITQLPNFNKLLKKSNIDYEEITAGEFKRTLTMFGKNTEKGRKKVVEQVEDAHSLFKQFITRHRAQVDISQVATGEYWYASRALELKLVDALMTSDDFLLAASAEADLFAVTFEHHKTLKERVSSVIELTFKRALDAIWQTAQDGRYL